MADDKQDTAAHSTAPSAVHQQDDVTPRELESQPGIDLTGYPDEPAPEGIRRLVQERIQGASWAEIDRGVIQAERRLEGADPLIVVTVDHDAFIILDGNPIAVALLDQMGGRWPRR